VVCIYEWVKLWCGPVLDLRFAPGGPTERVGFFPPAPAPTSIMVRWSVQWVGVWDFGAGVRNGEGCREPAGYDFYGGEIGSHLKQWRESHQIKQASFISRPGKKASRMDIDRLRSSVPPGAGWN
jgi:hypothetical protein